MVAVGHFVPVPSERVMDDSDGRVVGLVQVGDGVGHFPAPEVYADELRRVGRYPVTRVYVFDP